MRKGSITMSISEVPSRLRSVTVTSGGSIILVDGATGRRVGVGDGVAVGVTVAVSVGVAVRVAVGVTVGVFVGVAVSVGVAVFVGVGVGVFVGVYAATLKRNCFVWLGLPTVVRFVA